MTDEWMTTSQAAAEAGVQRQTVARWIREGRLPARAIRSGSRVIYRIRRATFAEWVRRNIEDFGRDPDSW